MTDKPQAEPLPTCIITYKGDIRATLPSYHLTRVNDYGNTEQHVEVAIGKNWRPTRDFFADIIEPAILKDAWKMGEVVSVDWLNAPQE